MISYGILPFTEECIDQASCLHASTFDPSWSAEEFKSILHMPGTFGLKACSEQNIMLGYILLNYIVEDAEILTFLVSKSYRRHRVGKALLEAGIKQLYLKGANRLLLEVNEYNKAALLFYNALNFKPYGRRKNYYLLKDGKQADALLLQIYLNNEVKL